MASTGIAAELLHEGKTVHSAICRAKHVDASTPVMIDPLSLHAKKIRMAHILIIDEVSMLHKDVLEFIDKTIRTVVDIRLKHLPFGGKVSFSKKKF